MFIRLLKKEFIENAWKIAACCVIGVSISILMLRLRITEDLLTVRWISTGYIIFLPLIFCVDMFSGEMSRRTIYLLFKLPVSRVKVFAAKFLFVLIAAIIVCSVNAIVVEYITKSREQASLVLAGDFLYSLIAIISVTSWFCVVGCICRNEAVSAVMLLCVYIGWGCVYLFAGLYEHPWLMKLGPICFGYEAVNLINLNYWLSYLFATLLPVIIAACRYSRIRRFL